MISRQKAMAAFLAAQDIADTAPPMLAGDASPRKYYRALSNDGPLVVMDAPPPGENVRPFMALSLYLGERGFSAPGILAADKAAGFLLLEDFGDASYSRVIKADPGREQPLYEAAVDLLVALQSEAVPQTGPLWLAVDGSERHALPAYDQALLLQEAALFTDWYLPALTGSGKAGLAEDLAALLKPLLAPLFAAKQVLVLRDYHADNLMWLPARQGMARVGLLDFQDAVIGHPAYDLVSLLQDARRDVPAALEAAMIERFLEARRDAGNAIDADAFRRAYALLGVQRNAKILGIFTRLWKRDGKVSYLDLMPRVWGLLERSLQHEDMAALSAFFDAHVPGAVRRVAPSPETLHP